MVEYALAVNDGGVTRYVQLQNGTLGYPHVIVDDNGTNYEIENEPPEAPPTGKFPWLQEDGVTILLVDFVVYAATGDGPLELFSAYLGTTVDERWRAMQLGDQTQVGLMIRDADGDVDLTGAQLLEIKCTRADRTPLTIAGTAWTIPGKTVPSVLLAQFGPGEVQSIGDWLIQGHVIRAGGREFRTEVLRVLVNANV